VLAIDAHVQISIVVVVVGPEVQVNVVFLSVHGVSCVVEEGVETLRI
jgi:hypothetical protein